jgi:mRNA interferase MazF
LSGSKLRPAVILSETATNITVSFITTQLQWQEPADLLINPSPSNGLKKQSLIRTGKIATLSISLAKGLLGNLNVSEINDLNNKLKILFGLP